MTPHGGGMISPRAFVAAGVRSRPARCIIASRGRVGQAIGSLVERGAVRFIHTELHRDGRSDFIVCDDEREVARAALDFTTTKDTILEHGPHILAAGEWIAFSRTDYSAVPPDIRAGCLARIAYILPEGRKIVVQHPDNRLQEVDLANSRM
ncbi:hypothetical protein ACVWXL_005745 [Bradyrhizobium sp. GM22.5]